ncbi:MAG TPA: DUF2275 domain-containing protein [Thermodesulfovibrionales bacterium]|nr:DUF2275 domain-containing protein [Thermodesulfovibrionales bacterium]
MDCKTIQESLSAFIDGALSAEEKLLVEEHLKSCSKCGEALGDLRKTVERVRQIEEVEAPPWLAEKIMARVRSERPPKRGLFRTLFYPLRIKLPIEACAAILIAVVAMHILKPMQPEMRLAKAPSEETMKGETPSPVRPPDDVSMPSKKPDVAMPKKEEPSSPSSSEEGRGLAEGEQHESSRLKESVPAPASPENKSQLSGKTEIGGSHAESAKAAPPAMKPSVARSADALAKGEVKGGEAPFEPKLKALTNGEVFIQGDDISITVTNMSEHNVEIADGQFINSGFAKVEKKDDRGAWMSVELFTAANVIAKRTLKPRESHVYIWRTAGLSRNGTPVVPGIYRINLGDQTYTNNFEIKESR